MDSSLLPIDHGWAWVIVAANFLMRVVIGGVTRAFGIVFTELVDYYQASASVTAITFSLSTSLGAFLAPIISPLCDVLTSRAVCMGGLIVASLGLFVSSLSKSIVHIIIAYGVFYGIGASASSIPGSLILSSYFKKRRSLAQGMMLTGTGFGAIAVPFVVEYFIEHYFLHGTLMLLAAMVMQMVVAAALLRPVSFYLRSSQAQVDGIVDEKVDLTCREGSGLRCRSTMDLTQCDLVDIQEWQYSKSCMDLTCTYSESVNTLQPQSKLRAILWKLCTVRNAETKELQPFFNFGLLKQGRLVLFFAGSCCASSAGILSMMLPARAVELGLPAIAKPTLLAVLGISDILGRLAVGFIGDLKCLRHHRIWILVFSVLFLTVLFFVFSFLIDFYAIIMICAILAPFYSAIITLKPVVLEDLIESKDLSSAWGLNIFFQGFSFAICPIIVGAIADTTGSYFGGFLLLALLMGASTVCFLLSACWSRLHI